MEEEAAGRGKRRLVQSTLFGKQIADKKEDVENCDNLNCEIQGEGNKDEDEDDEWCGSQKKKQKKQKNSKPKAPQSRSSKKVAVNKSGDDDSPVNAKSSFFVKVSEKRQQKEQPPILSSPENTYHTTPDSAANKKSSRKLKRQCNSTPKKKLVNCETNHACLEQEASIVPDKQDSQSVPNLRLEAKMTAEENSRLFSGRQIHPFFSSCKASKRSQETIDVETYGIKEKGITFNPIHIYERDEDSPFTPDWRHWMISERSFVGANYDIERGYSPFNEGSVNSLQFDDFPLSCQPGISLVQRDNPQKEENEIGKVDFTLGFPGCASLDTDGRERILEERVISDNYNCFDLPKNCLWTEKYQPEKAVQVCGNHESVKLISEWLHLWHERGSKCWKDSIKDEKSIAEDDDYNCFQSDAESEDIDEDTRLKNVLLITGPVGSGKSAAIYACAKEEGFQVIEVNASDWRNGALVKQKFGEAVESHWLQHTLEKPVKVDKNNLSKLFPVSTRVTKMSDSEVLEVIPLSDEENTQHDCAKGEKSFGRENQNLSYQNGIKILILFEDVDVTLTEDRGFVATIQELAETAKRPMILTSNSNSPMLPNNLKRLEVGFTAPSLEELLNLAYKICAAEKTVINPILVEKFINYCRRDIRRTILHLQFWFQGWNLRGGPPGYQLQRTCSPVSFDLDACHTMLPELIPWSFPSRLSELVEEEIKSFIITEESDGLGEQAEEDDKDNRKTHSSTMRDCGLDHVKAKKDAMLSLHCSAQDASDFEVRLSPNCDFLCTPDSPVAVTRRSGRKKYGTVFSSDSEDECQHDRIAALSGRDDDNNYEEGEMKSTAPSHCLPTENLWTASANQLSNLEYEVLKGNCGQFSETATYLLMDDMCKSAEISSVPESSFVPETEVGNGTSFWCHPYGIETDSVSICFPPKLVKYEGDKLYDPPTMQLNKSETWGGQCGIDRSALFLDDVTESSIKPVEGKNDVLDECSRMDFDCPSVSLTDCRSCGLIDSVEQAWRKLRESHLDLRHHAISEPKDVSQVLHFTYEISNLISDTDVLSRDCRPVICDSLEQLMIPDEISQSFRWYDDQLQMSSAIAQHGLCLFATEFSGLGSSVGSISGLDLASKVLASSTNSMALGKLARQDWRTLEDLESRELQSQRPLESKSLICLDDILRSVVPSRSYLALRGYAFHEYLSSLTQISRSEARRLSECINKRKQRRSRVARHYLSSGALNLSADDISVVDQYNCFQKHTSETGEAIVR